MEKMCLQDFHGNIQMASQCFLIVTLKLENIFLAYLKNVDFKWSCAKAEDLDVMKEDVLSTDNQVIIYI